MAKTMTMSVLSIWLVGVGGVHALQVADLSLSPFTLRYRQELQRLRTRLTMNPCKIVMSGE